MDDDYRQRCHTAAQRIALSQTELTSTMQVAWVSNLVDAVLAERDDEMEQLRYERRLLGAARMVLDLVAAGDPSRWEQARQGAEDVAQRIVDEIGHPVTDEPALGPAWRERAEQAEREITRLRALLDGQDIADDDTETEPGYETVTAHLGELHPITCPKCGSDDLLAATIYGLTASSSRVMGEMAVCHGCGWSPYGEADEVRVRRADLDLVMNHAGDPATVAEYPAACQRIQDTIERGRRG